MNMMMDVTAASNISRDPGSASTSWSVDQSGKSGVAFQSLLAKLSGQVDGESKLGNMNESLPLMSSLLPLLAGNTAEEEVVNWLEQLLQQLEQLEPSSLELLEQNPDLAAAWTGFIEVQVSNSSPQAGETQQAVQQRAIPVEQLMGTIRQWIASIKHGDDIAQTALGQAQAFRQFMQSLPSTNTNVLVEQQEHVWSSSLSIGTKPVLVHNGVMPRITDAASPREQQASANSGSSQQQVNALPVTGATQTALFPKVVLLRPELLEPALDGATEAASTESKSGETSTLVQLQSTLTQEAAKVSTDAATVRQSEPQTAQVPYDRFVQHLERFVTRSFQITQQNGFTEAKISLVPEHLGQVDIKLSMHNGQLTAQIVTETAAGREALEQQLGVLRSALQAQGIQVEKLEITQQSHTAASFSFLKDHGQQQSARQFQQQSSSRSAGYEEETIDFHEELELIDSEYETVYRGRAFHAMA